MLELEGAAVKQCVKLMGTLYKMFIDKDMEMLEINPLILTTAGDLKCLDAKMGFDSNAVYRHADIAEMRDESEEDPKELVAGDRTSTLVFPLPMDLVEPLLRSKSGPDNREPKSGAV